MNKQLRWVLLPTLPALAGLGLDALLACQGMTQGMRVLGIGYTWGLLLTLACWAVAAAILWGLARRCAQTGRPYQDLRRWTRMLAWFVGVLVAGGLLNGALLALGIDPYYVHGGREGRSVASWGNTVAIFTSMIGYVMLKVLRPARDKSR